MPPCTITTFSIRYAPGSWRTSQTGSRKYFPFPWLFIDPTWSPYAPYASTAFQVCGWFTSGGTKWKDQFQEPCASWSDWVIRVILFLIIVTESKPEGLEAARQWECFLIMDAMLLWLFSTAFCSLECLVLVPVHIRYLHKWLRYGHSISWQWSSTTLGKWTSRQLTEWMKEVLLLLDSPLSQHTTEILSSGHNKLIFQESAKLNWIRD